MDNAELSDIIGVIYDCALEPEKWPEALAGIARATRSTIGYIVFHDLESNSGGRFFEHGMDEAWLAAYFERFASLNPIPAISISRPVGEVHSLDTLFERREWTSSAFYRGWMQPQALGDMVGLLALRSEMRAGWLALQRPASQPDYGEADFATLRIFSPHICRSLRIADVLDLRTVTSQALDRTLDGLTASVFLLDRNGRVVRTNESARRLLAAGTTMRVAGGRLLPLDRNAETALRDALAQGTAEPLNGQPAPSSIALPSRSGNGMIATVLPLDRGSRRHMVAPFAAAKAVFIQDAATAPSVPMEAFAALHKLTGAEARFLAVLMTGVTVKAAAEMLGVAETTGKTHLQHLFMKTGTGRQTELLKLLLSSSPPVH